MAYSTAAAPSTRIPRLQIPWPEGGGRSLRRIERWLESEREQLPLWLPVMLGLGIAIWFVSPDPRAWRTAILAATGLGLGAAAIDGRTRLARAVATGALAVAIGVALAWWHAERATAPVLAHPAVVRFAGVVEQADPLTARGLVRLTIRPDAGLGLPTRIRVNVDAANVGATIAASDRVRLSARLLPPPEAAVPGAFDYARVAWFAGIGATGRAFGPLSVSRRGSEGGAALRDRLTRHITAQLEGSAGGIAAALATGDEGAISQADAEAMRRAGLAHLLSVSGLHITAAVGATMIVVLRLLALWPWLALRIRLPLVAAMAGAAAAIGYTWLTGNQIPTIRSCVAALMVLAAMAMGRQAITLRLVAGGALVVLIGWPDALVGPSFQLSFAAIVSIVAFHEHPRIASLFAAKEVTRVRRVARELLSLLVTGLLVEAALMPIAIYHFHRAGLYGAFANIVAIPLTTFVIMPLEALALLMDAAGLGAPVWWLTGKGMALLLWIARSVAALPGSGMALATVPASAFALCVGGGLWLALWQSSVRWLGAVPLVAGCLWMAFTPAPDILITGDGRHLAVRTRDGLAVLRDRSGDYVRNMLRETGGGQDDPMLVSDRPEAQCTRDACAIALVRGGRHWRLLATRSAYPLPWEMLRQACARADIVVSDRRLPARCRPRWLRLDLGVLRRTGGVSIALASRRVVTVRTPEDAHPWVTPPHATPTEAIRYRDVSANPWTRRTHAASFARNPGSLGRGS